MRTRAMHAVVGLLMLVVLSCGREADRAAERAALGELTVEEHIVISDAWVRSAPPSPPEADTITRPAAVVEPPPAGTNSAAYLRIRNRAEESDRLMLASSAAAGATELHQTLDEEGMVRMRRVDGVDVQAGGEVSMEPGGLHIMLIDLNRRLVRGDSLELQLRFERAGEIHVRAEVRD